MKTEKLTIWDVMKYPNAGIMTEFGKSAINKILIGAEALTLWMHDRPVEYLKTVGVEHCQLILRSIDQLTEDEKKYLITICSEDKEIFSMDTLFDEQYREYFFASLDNFHLLAVNHLRSINIDIDGFIESGKAVKE